MHPYQWLWEPLEMDPTFTLRAMFGAKAVYIDGKLQLCFMAKTEPWRGVLVCTDRACHGALIAEFPMLSPHAILPKWLYLPESSVEFERVATTLVQLVSRRDPRIGVDGQTRKRRNPAPAPARANSPRKPTR